VARTEQRLAANTDGPFYVDASCIDCGTCWQWDPAHFAPSGETSHVWAQPSGEGEIRQALLALQACPVAAIGTSRELLRQTPADGFPALISRHPAGNVYYCGWASHRSFGASSWLLVRPGGGGNVLIDSPRFSRPLARRLQELGGLGRSCSGIATTWPTTPSGPGNSAARAGSTPPMPMPPPRPNTGWRGRRRWTWAAACG
jgi:ferredoxin